MEIIEQVLKHKKDFFEYPNYVEEIAYIEPILKDLPDIENMKNDKKLNQIFSSSKCRRFWLKDVDFQIYLSQFAYETLLSVSERSNIKSLTQMFFQNKNSKLNVSRNISTSSYVGKLPIQTKLT